MHNNCGMDKKGLGRDKKNKQTTDTSYSEPSSAQ